jgi:hypothetical protein
VFSDVDYAKYLELGTVFMEPRPYLAPALDAEEPTFIHDLQLAIDGAFDV